MKDPIRQEFTKITIDGSQLIRLGVGKARKLPFLFRQLNKELMFL